MKAKLYAKPAFSPQPSRRRLCETLRHTLAWSYDLLDDEEQQLFRRLSVFVGGCTLEAVEGLSMALGELPADVLDGMASLLDKSLLRQTGQEAETARFMTLETIREYGLPEQGRWRLPGSNSSSSLLRSPFD